MPIPIFLAKVEKNRLKLENPDQFNLWCRQFEGKDVQVIVKKKTRKRTSGQIDELGNQNGYLHGVVFTIAAKETGHTLEEIKEIFITMFSPYKIMTLNGKSVSIHKRTSEMNTFECAEFIDSIICELAKINIIIPSADKIV